MPIDLPPVTRALLISNVGIFLLQQLFPDALLIHFALWPLGSELLPDGTTLGFQIWQLRSSQLISHHRHIGKNAPH